MNIREIDGKAVLSYFNASTGNMEVRVAYDPTGLGTAPATTVVRAGEWPDPVESLPRRRTTGSRSPTGLYLAGFDARRGAGVRQPVEHRAAGSHALPGDPVRGEPVQAVV